MLFTAIVWSAAFCATSGLHSERTLFEIFSENATIMASWKQYWRLNLVQQKWSEDFGLQYGVPLFQCEAKPRSLEGTKATSVHNLHPSDIELVGVIGDSLASAAYALCTNISCLFNNLTDPYEWRGVSFSGGGEQDLSRMTTLPNLLKYFSPNISGQSYGVSAVDDFDLSQLNVAIAGSTSYSGIEQAQLFTDRVNTYDNWSEKWKLITYELSLNDIALFCIDSNVTVSAIVTSLNRTIEYLYQNVPRVFLQIVSPLDVTMLKEPYSTVPICKDLHDELFACLADPGIDEFIRELREAIYELVDSGVYQNENFTVVVQPAYEETHLVTLPSVHNDTDFSIFGPDCLHPNRKGHSLLATALWNNLLEPVGNKSRLFLPNWFRLQALCPTEPCPFIRTAKNSVDCVQYVESRIHSISNDGAVSKSSSDVTTIVIALLASALGVVVLVLLCVFCCSFYKRKKRTNEYFEFE